MEDESLVPALSGSEDTSRGEDVTTDLEPYDRAYLRRFLVAHYSLGELKDLAFDLGVDYELFDHHDVKELARELVAYLERRTKLDTLLKEVIRQRPMDSKELLVIASKVPDSSTTTTVVVVVRLQQGQKANAYELRQGIARALGVSMHEVAIPALAGGSLRLLVVFPSKAYSLPTISRISSLCSGKYQVDSIQPFDFLDVHSQMTWRLVACKYPPERQVDTLVPAISWASALELTAPESRASFRETYRPYTDSRTTPDAHDTDEKNAESQKNQASSLDGAKARSIGVREPAPARTSKPTSTRIVGRLGQVAAVVLAVGVGWWLYRMLRPRLVFSLARLRWSWAELVTGPMTWRGFFVSMFWSFILLSAINLGLVFIYTLVLCCIVLLFSQKYLAEGGISELLTDRRRLITTFAAVGASITAPFLFSWLLQYHLDGWDWGIQLLLAIVIVVTVLVTSK